MPEVKWTLKSQMEELKAAMLSAASTAQATAGGYDKIGDALAALESSIAKHEKALSRLTETQSKESKKAAAAQEKAAADTIKAFEGMAAAAEAMAQREEKAREAEWKAAEKAVKQEEAAREREAKAAEKAAARKAEAAEKARKKAEEEAAALEEMADRAEMAASKMATSGSRTYNLLIKVGGEYAQMLRDGVKENDDLYKSWLKGLAPAERSALVMVKAAAATDDLKLASRAASVATSNLSEMIEDQARRAEMNVGSQNKLSRSLSELIDELKAAQKGTLAVAVAQAQSAETADDVAMAMRKLAFETNDADKEGTEYKRTLAAMQARMEGLKIEETEAKRATEALAEAYGKQKQRLDALETAMDSLSIPGASLVTRFKQMSDSLETMSEHGSKTQANLLKTSIAIGAVGMAGAAAVAGVAALGAAVVSVAAQADEWNEELGKLGLKLDAMGTGQVDRAAAAIDAVGAAAKAAGVAMAQQLSPEIEEAATRAVALGLAAVDMFTNLDKGGGVIEHLAKMLSQVLVSALTSPLRAAQLVIESINDLSSAVGINIGPMQDAAETVDRLLSEFEDDQVNGVTAALSMMAREGLEPLIAASDDYMGKAAQLVKRQEAVNRASRDSTKALEDQAKAARKLAEAQAKASSKDMADALRIDHELRQALIEDDRARAEAAKQVAEAQAKAADTSRLAMAQALAEQYEYNEALVAAEAAAIEWEQAVKDSRQTMGETMVEFGQWMQQTLSPVGDFLGGVYAAGASLVDTVIQQATGVNLWSLLLEHGADAGDVLQAALLDIDFESLMAGMAEGFIGVLATLNNPAIWTSMIDGMAAAIGTLGESAGPMIGDLALTIITALVDAMPTMIPALIDAGISIAVGLIEAIPDITIALAAAMPEIAVSLIDALVEGIPTLVDALVENAPEIVMALSTAMGAVVLSLLAKVLDAMGLDKAADALEGISNTAVSSLSASASAPTAQPVQSTATVSALDSESMMVTDAYYPAVAGRRSLTLSPGDVAQVTRGGALGSSGKADPELLAATNRQTEALMAQNALLEALRRDLLYQRHQQAAGAPAGRY